jgi:hypothetical protein
LIVFMYCSSDLPVALSWNWTLQVEKHIEIWVRRWAMQIKCYFYSPIFGRKTSIQNSKRFLTFVLLFHFWHLYFILDEWTWMASFLESTPTAAQLRMLYVWLCSITFFGFFKTWQFLDFRNKINDANRGNLVIPLFLNPART